MHKTNALLVGGTLLAALMLASYAAGPLTPPGAPGDGSNGGPSLSEIKAAIDAAAYGGRTPIPAQTATFTISTPGSYVLKGNISVATGDGIIISASNVTLDLGGFTISSTEPVGGTSSAIRTTNTASSIRIHNGRIASGFSTQGAGTPGTGFGNGVQFDATPGSQVDNFVIEDLMIIGVNGRAISPSFEIIGFTIFVQNAIARRIIVDGKRGIEFWDPLDNHRFGKVIDCDVKTNGTFRSVIAASIGQTTARNLHYANGTNNVFSAILQFDNHEQE